MNFHENLFPSLIFWACWWKKQAQLQKELDDARAAAAQFSKQIDESVSTPAVQKVEYATTGGIPNILIDDRGLNIQRWRDAGGFGIKYQADEDSLQKVTDGLKAYEDDWLD